MKKYAAQIIVLLVLVLAVCFASYMFGRSHAKEECLQESVKREQVIQEHLSNIQSDLSTIAGVSTAQEQKLREDMDQILSRLKKSPTIVYKDGKCIPSATYLDSIDQAVNRANKR